MSIQNLAGASTYTTVTINWTGFLSGDAISTLLTGIGNNLISGGAIVSQTGGASGQVTTYPFFDFILNMENGNDGDAVTTTGQMNASIIGNTGLGNWNFQNPTFQGFFVSTGNSISGNFSNTGASYNFFNPISVNGQITTDTGTRGWVYNHGVNGTGLGLRYIFSSPPANLSVGAFMNFRLSGAAAGGTYDHIVLADAAGKSASVNQKVSVPATSLLQLEDTNFFVGTGTNGTGIGGSGGFVNVTGTQDYWVTMLWKQGVATYINVYSPNVTGFALLGSLSGYVTANPCHHFIIGQNGHNGVSGLTYWDNFAVSTSGTWPLLPTLITSGSAGGSLSPIPGIFTFTGTSLIPSTQYSYQLSGQVSGEKSNLLTINTLVANYPYDTGVIGGKYITGIIVTGLANNDTSNTTVTGAIIYNNEI